MAIRQFPPCLFPACLKRAGGVPVRYDGLIMDFDYKENPEMAILAAGSLLEAIALNYSLDLTRLKYWMSCGKGCHVLIPSEIHCHSASRSWPYNDTACRAVAKSSMLPWARVWRTSRHIQASSISSRGQLFMR